MVPPIPPEASKEIEFVKSLVAKHFPVYDVRVSYDVVQFFCRVEPSTLEENFERMREDMAAHGYIPMITYEKGEHIVQVARKPKMKYRSIYVNLAFFIVTFLTMLLAGVIDWASYAGVKSEDIFSLETIMMGILVFTLPLMAILGVHELAHFFMARRRKVAASLPFFIPSIPPLGTFGAFISLRDPIPNRKALLEIGVAGPLAGLALAVPIGILGLILTNDGAKLTPLNEGGNVVGVSFPLLYLWIEQFVPLQGHFLLHPTAFAAWVGILVTALNLLPVGQLDGGHVARALLGDKSRYLSWATIAIMIGLSYFYFGWLLFAFLILFLGARHPPPLNDISGLGARRKAIGIGTFLVLIIAFVPQPMVPIAADYSFDMVSLEPTNVTVAPGESHLFPVKINNTGNTFNEIQISSVNLPLGWSVDIKRGNQSELAYEPQLSLTLNSTETALIDVLITSSSNTTLGEQQESVTVRAQAKNSTFSREIKFNFTLTAPTFTYWVVDPNITIVPGGEAAAHLQFNNTGVAPLNLTFEVFSPGYLGAVLTPNESFDPNATSVLNVTVDGGGNVTVKVWVYASLSAPPGEKTLLVDVSRSGLTIAVLKIGVSVT